ncbi:MAG TPA: hypothetical protein ENF37_08845 [Beggiatoa sp.]|nr:hypothetical protein [Beggiatoa sp.]
MQKSYPNYKTVALALEEYEVIASYYSGYEAKCRYALLLSTEAQINRYFTARGNHKGLPLRAVRRGNPLWLPIFLVVSFN